MALLPEVIDLCSSDSESIDCEEALHHVNSQDSEVPPYKRPPSALSVSSAKPREHHSPNVSDVHRSMQDRDHSSADGSSRRSSRGDNNSDSDSCSSPIRPARRRIATPALASNENLENSMTGSLRSLLESPGPSSDVGDASQRTSSQKSQASSFKSPSSSSIRDDLDLDIRPADLFAPEAIPVAVPDSPLSAESRGFSSSTGGLSTGANFAPGCVDECREQMNDAIASDNHSSRDDSPAQNSTSAVLHTEPNAPADVSEVPATLLSRDLISDDAMIMAADLGCVFARDAGSEPELNATGQEMGAVAQLPNYDNNERDDMSGLDIACEVAAVTQLLQQQQQERLVPVVGTATLCVRRIPLNGNLQRSCTSLSLQVAGVAGNMFFANSDGGGGSGLASGGTWRVQRQQPTHLKGQISPTAAVDGGLLGSSDSNRQISSPTPPPALEASQFDEFSAWKDDAQTVAAARNAELRVMNFNMLPGSSKFVELCQAVALETRLARGAALRVEAAAAALACSMTSDGADAPLQPVQMVRQAVHTLEAMSLAEPSFEPAQPFPHTRRAVELQTAANRLNVRFIPSFRGLPPSDEAVAEAITAYFNDVPPSAMIDNTPSFDIDPCTAVVELCQRLNRFESKAFGVPLRALPCENASICVRCRGLVLPTPPREIQIDFDDDLADSSNPVAEKPSTKRLHADIVTANSATISGAISKKARKQLATHNTLDQQQQSWPCRHIACTMVSPVFDTQLERDEHEADIRKYGHMDCVKTTRRLYLEPTRCCALCLETFKKKDAHFAHNLVSPSLLGTTASALAGRTGADGAVQGPLSPADLQPAIEQVDDSFSLPISLPSGQQTLLVMSRTEAWRRYRCPHLLCAHNGKSIYHPVHHACQSTPHVGCLAHFGPERCQACFLLLLALQMALTAFPAASAALDACADTRASASLPSTELAAIGPVRRAALDLRAYAGVVYLRPEGPIMQQVLRAIDERAEHDAAHPSWTDRRLNVQCLHGTCGQGLFYLRHHSEIFAPLLQLTGFPVALKTHSTPCSRKHMEACLGCVLEAEHATWVEARVERATLNPQLFEDDSATYSVLPDRLVGYAASIAPLLAALPLQLAAALADRLGIEVIQTKGAVTQAGDNFLAESLWSIVWNHTTIPPDMLLTPPISFPFVTHPTIHPSIADESRKG